jgi:hypothetical protein
MNKLFGASQKKKEPEPINPNAPSLTETSAKVSLLSRFKIIMIKIVRRAW